MKPQKQRNHHRPAEGVYGDCFRTVIASMLELEPEEVPHENRELGDGEQDTLMNVWLAGRGLRFVQVPYAVDPEDAMGIMAEMYPGLLYVLGGRSRTGVNHFVICRDREIVSDPSLTDAGIVGRCDDDHVWIGHIVYQGAAT
jgi:hypothetical protein